MDESSTAVHISTWCPGSGEPKPLEDFLVYFYWRNQKDYGDFPIDEFQALCELNGCSEPFPEGFWETKKKHRRDPFVWVKLPNEEFAKRICSRSILVRGIYKVIAKGSSLSKVADDLTRFDVSSLSPAILDATFRVRSQWFGKKCPMDSKKAEVCALESFLRKLPGAISLTQPRVVWSVVSDFGDSAQRGNPTPLSAPLRVFFGRLIGESNRHPIDTFKVKKRPYFGPTALESELALLMANQSHVVANSVVMDPFVGTGSLLLCAAHFGAFCIGSDIDIRTIRGDAKKRKTIYANFEKYRFPLPELVRSDLHSSVWRLPTAVPLLDAVICDPPYGIRAGGRKSGASTAVFYTIDEEKRAKHIPKTQVYSTEECLADLLEFCAKNLRIGGRLVYLFPTTVEYSHTHLPTHPCLEVRGNSEQQCQGIFRRRLVTMQKIREFGEEMRATVPPPPDFESIRERVMKKRKAPDGDKLLAQRKKPKIRTTLE